MKTKRCLLPVLILLVFLPGCRRKQVELTVAYLQEGKLQQMAIPLDGIKSKTELSSPYVRQIACSILDSTAYVDNDPDEQVIYSTPTAVDFTKRIRPHSVEYYAIYTVYCIDRVIDYYNSLFDGRIDFNAQQEYRDIGITLGDVPYLTTPDSYIFEKGANPSPSLFYHEIGHRAFWYLEGEMGIRFGGLSYVHMGLLEYFTVSLNDSPVVGEDALPHKMIRSAAWIYSYPPADSLSLEYTMNALKDSYPEQMKDPESNVSNYYHASMSAYRDYMGVIDNHRGGMIVTSTLWRIREQLGRERTDRLVAGTILRLNGFMDQRPSFYPADEKVSRRIEWYDLYYGLISMNREWYGGSDEAAFSREFRKTGFPVDKIDTGG